MTNTFRLGLAVPTTDENCFIVAPSDLILITGSSGFIGSQVVRTLLANGYTNLRCIVRPSSNLTSLHNAIAPYSAARVNIVEGNLLSREDCEGVTRGAVLVYHLAAGRGEKSYPDAFLNSVVTTRNLLDGIVRDGRLRRFVNVSSFSVYSNWFLRRDALLDEACEIERRPQCRGDAYTYAKVKQEELINEYARLFQVPFVTVRPGVVYGPGKRGIHGRIGIDTFGFLLHLGGGNTIPLTYVDNCADAIALSGLVAGVDGETFNVVDDQLPSARTFLRLYKRRVRRFRSLYVPYPAFYLFCYMWEKYSVWSQGQLPPVFNRRACQTFWKGNQYSNAKLKSRLGWKQRIATDDGLNRYFEFQRAVEGVQ
jgi:nucleoside-diphosphate-sugar epimerase